MSSTNICITQLATYLWINIANLGIKCTEKQLFKCISLTLWPARGEVTVLFPLLKLHNATIITY